MALKVYVEVYASIDAFEDGDKALREYSMNHDNAAERRVLGEQCYNAFKAGQMILTYSKDKRK